MDFKMKGLSAVVLSAGIMVGGVVSVQAATIGLSYIDINNSKFTYADGANKDEIISAGVAKPGSLVFTNSTGANSSYNGAPAPGVITSQEKGMLELEPGGSGNFDLNLYNPSGPNTSSAPADDSFDILTNPVTSGNFSVADTELTGAILDFSALGGAQADAADADTYSVVNLFSSGSASAGSDIRNTSNLFFTAADTMLVNYSFDLRFYLETWLSEDALVGSFADASVKYTVELIDQTEYVRLIDFDLSEIFTTSVDTIAPYQNIHPVNNYLSDGNYKDSDTYNFSKDITFTKDHQYTLKITQESQVNSINVVPEPTSLALLGLGLLGFGAVKRRKA